MWASVYLFAKPEKSTFVFGSIRLENLATKCECEVNDEFSWTYFGSQ